MRFLKCFTAFVLFFLVISVVRAQDGYLSTRLQWYKVDPYYKVDKYQVQLDTTAAFSAPLVGDSSVTDTLYQVPIKVKFYTWYYWRVRGHNSSGWSPWSATWNFRTQAVPLPPAPTLVSPPNGSSNISQEFEWGVTPEATAYEFQLSRSSRFWSYTSIKVPVNFTIVTLRPCTRYYWRVRAYIGDTSGKFSPIWSLRT